MREHENMQGWSYKESMTRTGISDAVCRQFYAEQLIVNVKLKLRCVVFVFHFSI